MKWTNLIVWRTNLGQKCRNNLMSYIWFLLYRFCYPFPKALSFAITWSAAVAVLLDRLKLFQQGLELSSSLHLKLSSSFSSQSIGLWLRAAISKFNAIDIKFILVWPIPFSLHIVPLQVDCFWFKEVCENSWTGSTSSEDILGKYCCVSCFLSSCTPYVRFDLETNCVTILLEVFTRKLCSVACDYQYWLRIWNQVENSFALMEWGFTYTGNA
jgi:uncharacterized protein YhhL (DUF1145 family)